MGRKCSGGNDGEEREGWRLLHFGTVPRVLHLSAWIPRGILQIWKNPREGGDENNMTLATTYSSNGLPREYHRRIGLNFRVRNGNGCFPDAMTTRVMSQMKTRRKCRMPAPSKLYEPITSPTY